MDVPRRIVVLDDDARVRELVQSAFRSPEFEVHAFADGRDALMKLHEIAPELILSDVWMPEVDGRLFMQVVKRSPVLKDVPFLFLTACDARSIEAALEGGANGYLMKPFPISQLREKVRTMLGMPKAGAGGRRVPEFPAPVLRNGRPMIAPAQPVPPREESAPASPPALEMRPPGGEGGSRATDDEVPGTPPLPAEIEGRFTMAFVAGRQIPVLTEAGNRPNFTVTTCMTSDGRAIRKIETSWQHPLERAEDVGSAQSEVRLQHEQALAALEQIGLTRMSRRVVWEAKRRLVDGALLCWALTALWREARSRLGFDLATGLLRSSFERVHHSQDGLRIFRLTEDGRVGLSGRGGPLVSHAVVVAAAEWAVAFVLASRTGAETVVGAVRRATAAKAAQLERIGFTAALAGASQRATRKASLVDGREERSYHEG